MQVTGVSSPCLTHRREGGADWKNFSRQELQKERKKLPVQGESVKVVKKEDCGGPERPSIVVPQGTARAKEKEGMEGQLTVWSETAVLKWVISLLSLL